MTKYTLIAGATGGIGCELVREYAERGYVVFALAPESELWQLNPIKLRFAAVHTFATDIQDADSIVEAYNQVRELTTRLDVLFLNAGVCLGGTPGVEFTDVDLRQSYETNVYGPMYVVRQFIDYVITAKGQIVFQSLVGSRIPIQWCLIYGATSAAIDQYAWGLHSELEPLGVKVHSLITGGVNTGFADPVEVSTLPTHSRYNVQGMIQSIRDVLNMARVGTMEPEVYARRLLDQVSRRPHLFNIYEGTYLYRLHLLGRYFPVWITEWIVAAHFQATRVYKNLRSHYGSR